MGFNNLTLRIIVSIQLMSPASGDEISADLDDGYLDSFNVSIQLMSPASGDLKSSPRGIWR